MWGVALINPTNSCSLLRLLPPFSPLDPLSCPATTPCFLYWAELYRLNRLTTPGQIDIDSGLGLSHCALSLLALSLLELTAVSTDALRSSVPQSVRQGRDRWTSRHWEQALVRVGSPSQQKIVKFTFLLVEQRSDQHPQVPLNLR